MYYPALIVFAITLIPLFFTKYLFVADWERPKDLNGIDARMIIFWGLCIWNDTANWIGSIQRFYCLD